MAMSLQQQAQSQPMAQQLQQQPQAQQRPQQQQEQQEQQQQQQQQRGVSFGSLMPYLTNLVPPDQNVQLTALYQRMKNSEITRQDFVRGARVIAGEKLIMEALRRMNLGRPVRDPVPPQPQPQVQLQQQPQQLQHAQPQPSTSDVHNLSNKRPPGSEPTMAQASSSGKKPKLDSLEQINDVTAVGGVNLKEEEERLLTAPREESRTTAEMRRRFMEEDGRFFLEKGPLHTKVQEIAAKAGLKSISEDVEKCLSMSAEEWLWNFLHKSVRASKQRCDVEKDRHRVMVSLDFQKQIVAMRKEQLEFRQRKQAEEERQRKVNEEKNAAEEAKDGTGSKSQKSQQQDDKMRTTAANIAARKAVGADDVLSKWMLMAEQQQRQSNDTAWGVQRLQEQVTSPGGKALAGSTPRVNARRSALPPVARASRSIMLKDLVACLEREPGMCKSPLLYRLYEKLSSTEVSQP